MSQTKVQLIKDGALAEDSIVHDGDTNTKIRFPAADTITAETGGSERVRITTDGRVGVGTDPDSGIQLHVQKSGEANMILEGDVNGQGGFFMMKNNSDNANTTMSIQNLDAGGQGTSDITFQNVSNANNEGLMRFSTRPSGGSMTERMRITSGGLVTIATTSALINESGLSVRSGGNTCVLKAEGAAGHNPLICWNTNETGTRQQIQFGDGASFGSRGSITTNGGNVSYGGTSDYRRKQDDVLITDGIEKIKLLKPKRFKWKDVPDLGICDGFFAHEVQEVVPSSHAVTGTKDEVDSDGKPVYQQMDQSKLIPLLVAALQEAIGRIEVLEAK